jgi:hypothetical protein
MPLREVGTRLVALRLTRNISTNVEVVIEADETSSRGRRSTAPAGGSIIMAPRRGRAAQEELETELAEGEGETLEDDVMEEARIAAGEEETEAATEEEATDEDESEEE